ncbi:prolyl oligopeptidase family serine peptidase [Halobacteriovorax sp. JY17]|uniref:S9 family peptidase n=1 Tax=Halobacteriovorax sp. JY17 TaxID=2014617 RepID=UPI000C474B7B|nr:prolyl oligopeptidase family serine peptidase [Halobacteriovorax sp. JY17]PIK16255.1 MAG: S9 family peptidase [Halobacteriovorax sp. JY17]
MLGKFILMALCLLILSCEKRTQMGYSGHGVEAIDAKTLSKYAPTAIPKNLSTEIEAENEIRSTGLGQLTPDGKEMFFSWSVTGVRQIWKIEGPKSFPIQMTGGENGTSLEDITNDGKRLILSRDHGGDEYPSLFLQDARNGGELIKIFGEKKIKVSYLDQSEDGSKIYYRANDIAPTTWGIYEYDITSKKRELLYQGEGYWYIVELGQNGEMILGHALGNIAREFYLFNRRTKKVTPLLGQGEEESYYLRYSHITGKFLVLTNKFDNFKRLYSYDGKNFEAITEKLEMDINSISIAKDFSRILLRYNDQGYYKIKAINGKSYGPIKLPDFSKATHTFFGSTTRDSRYTIFSQAFYNRPRVSYVYDWKKGTMQEWTIPSSPELDTSHYTNWSLEYYPAADGTQIPMFVKRPKECEVKTCPVIISFHGGPESQSKPGFSPGAELFTKRGFIYVMPNVRGSSGYGKEWLNSDNGAKRLNVITDIRDSSIFIKKHWAKNGVVPKVGITGGSYGGYSTLYGMTVFADHFDAGVARVGMSSLVTFLENTAEYRRYLRETEYGNLKSDREVLEKLSPINYLNKVKSPLLIIQGANDPRVPAGEAIQFQRALEKNGVKSSLILFPDEGHGVKKRANRTLSTGHTLNFFIQWLK